MPYLLLQIVFVPLIASLAMLLVKPDRHRQPAWITIAVVAYTTVLLVMAGMRVSAGDIILEQYAIGPGFSFNLAADGLSLPVGLIINLICLALAFYSIHYVEHRIELIYGNDLNCIEVFAWRVCRDFYHGVIGQNQISTIWYIQ